MERDLSHLPAWYQKIRQSEDSTLAFWFGLLVAPVILTFAGFYLGTIIVDEHIQDLQLHDLVNGGLPGAAIGFLLGIFVFIMLSVVYPRHKAREEAYDAAQYVPRQNRHSDAAH